jgi:hypothetical protein
MRLHQESPIAHRIIYPSMRRTFVDSMLDRGAYWMRIDHIPWDENPLVHWELEAIKKGSFRRSKPRPHEWRYKGKIYHRDVLNNVWQKTEGKMTWIGIYDPYTDSFDFTATEPK